MPKVNVKFLRSNLLLSSQTGSRSVAGETGEVDPMRALHWARKGWVEYVSRAATRKPETRIAPEVETTRGELSGSDDPEEMTVRELRDALRARGEAIPHNAVKSDLIAMYRGDDEGS